ncbi:uncharacterized protein V6R79_000716 [Siganus canaliculatus]
MVDRAGLLLLLWAGVASSTVVDLHKRVLGGSRCSNNKHHYHVRLVTATEYVCGGTLISNQWVLTARHCFIPVKLYVEVGYHPNQGRVKKVEVLGDAVLYEDKDKAHHDLMLLKLRDCVTDIEPVRSPDCRTKPKTVQVAGYGSKTDGKCGISTTLQCAEMDRVSCDNFLKGGSYERDMHQRWFCAQRNGVEICKGDSGGGVVSNDMIYGIVSLSNPPEKGGDAAFIDLCDPHYAKWIEETTRIYWPV